MPPNITGTASATHRVTKFISINLSEYRLELYYLFGLACLASWFAFNLWILRDYFFPCWFRPIYTATGLSTQKLEVKKREILMRRHVNTAFKIPTSIVTTTANGERRVITLSSTGTSEAELEEETSTDARDRRVVGGR